MLTQYKNINQIETATAAVTGQRFTKNEQQLLEYPSLQNKYPLVTDLNHENNDTKIELHLYSNETWITGTHSTQLQYQIPQYIDSTTNRTITLNNPIAIDLRNELDTLNVSAGNFRIVVNFFKNLIGNYNQQYLAIDEISPDRTEIRLKPIDQTDATYLTQITNFINNVKQTTSIIDGDIALHHTYLLNFSRNQCVEFINSVVADGFLYVKLRDALPDQFNVNFKVWIVQEIKQPYIDNIAIIPELNLTSPFNKLAGPNWDANADYNTSNETGLRSWTDILGSSTQTSQQLVDTYFSGSLSGIKLNIDYSDFNNFIFYSSATERVENFRYKLELLEYYESQSLAIATISGSIAQNNAQDFTQLKTNLIGGFDNFEQYLYYQSSSILTTYTIPVIDATVPELTGSYITPVPKTNSTRPYELVSVNSNIFKTWYTTLYESASLYDTLNANALVHAVPEYIRFNEQNKQLDTFVNMLGHHYDILYTYIHHMNLVNKREENPKLGMPNELLYSVAKQFGWSLTDGYQSQELWKYVLGTNETGTPYTGSNSVGDPAVPGQDITYAIWRRIVNNLPLLLKSKGTKRSVQALMSCYGIPQSLISIHEYGGPRSNRTPIYEKVVSNYAIKFSENETGIIECNTGTPIKGIEFRFRTDDISINPLIPSEMQLLQIGEVDYNFITAVFDSGNKGFLRLTTPYESVDTDTFDIYDGNWTSVLLQQTKSARLDLIAKRSKYGKIVSSVSASSTAYSPLTASNPKVSFGYDGPGEKFQGQIQEIRFWSSSLSQSVFDNHVKAPSAYNGNSDTYSELLFRAPLTTKFVPTSSTHGIQPKNSLIAFNWHDWINLDPFVSVEETQYYDSVSIGGSLYDDNKIRLETNQLVGQLDVKTRAERSQYDTAPLDSNRVGIYFSPQSMVDEDIISQLGFVDLESYIGDPGNVNSKSYPELIQYSKQYWKKYSQRNDINAYIKMFTLFDLSFFKQLEQLLPARVEKLTGLLIQPNILERNRDSILPNVQYFNNTYETSINTDTISITAHDDDQLQAFLTASAADRYDSVPYSHNYLIRSGSTWITASSPYWLSEAVCPTIISSSLSAVKTIKTPYYVIDVDVATTSILTRSAYNNGDNDDGIGAFIQKNSGSAELIIDDVTLTIGSRILVKDGIKASPASSNRYAPNGVYELTDLGDGVTTYPTLTRLSVANQANEFYPQFIRVASGTTNKNTIFYQTDPSFAVIGTDIPTYEITNNTYTYPYAQIQDYQPAGVINHRYAGCKLTSPGFNINSTQTVDGKPVVEWVAANPNQLIYQTPGTEGSFTLI